MKLSDEMVYALSQLLAKGVRAPSMLGSSIRTFEALERRGFVVRSGGNSWAITAAGARAFRSLTETA